MSCLYGHMVWPCLLGHDFVPGGGHTFPCTVLDWLLSLLLQSLPWDPASGCPGLMARGSPGLAPKPYLYLYVQLCLESSMHWGFEDL